MLKTLLATSLLASSVVSGGELIPREELFRPSPCMSVKISPDAQRLAYIAADKSGAMNLMVSTDLTLTTAQQVTHFAASTLRGVHWSADGRKILFLKDVGGKAQFHLYLWDAASSTTKDLTPMHEQVMSKIFQVSRTKNQAVVGLNHRNPQFYDLYLLDLDSGALTLLYENSRYINFLIDDNLQIAVKIRMNADSSMTFLKNDETEWLTLSAADAFQTECLCYQVNEKALYLLDNRGSNTTQLKKISLDGKEERCLGHDPQSDIVDVIFDQNRPLAYSTYYTRKAWHLLDKAVERDIAFLTQRLGAEFEVFDQAQQNKLWVVYTEAPEQGKAWWLYNRVEQKLTSLYTSPKLPLAKMYAHVIKAQDGLPLVCYLTLPPEFDQKGKVTQPLPLVVLPHGGPFKVRDYYRYSPEEQWLANRGYAVLTVNFRLSSGFGKKHVTAGNRQHGKLAHQDVVDAVRWCVREGIAKADKVAIFGGSYGGYEALCGLTFTPDVFACAVAFAAPSNLKTVLEKVPFYWETMGGKPIFFTKNAFIVSMGGDPDNPADHAHLASCSPIHFVENIKKPLLLAHGVNDHIVASSESDQIFHTLQEKKIPVTYLSFPDEGHGLQKFDNREVFYAQAEQLLAKILGGRAEPLGRHQSKVLIQSSSLEK